jgi:RNA polymerase sigma-70 factor (ECF subfamily)
LESLCDGDAPVERGPSPEDSARTHELADHLRIAISRLDRRQAEIFCLVCLEGMSYQEVAQQLRLSRNHVGVLLNRARTRLRQMLAAHDPAPIDRS